LEAVTGAVRTEFERKLENARHRFSGQLGLAAKNLNTGEEILADANRLYPTASVIKLPILVEVFAQAHEGRLSLDERLEMTASDLVLGSGVLRDLGSGLRPSIRDLAVLMVIVSDNVATNMLIDRVGGVERVNERMHGDYGLKDIHLHNRVDFEKIGDDVRRFAESTPRAMMELAARIALEEVVSPEACRQMLEIMGRQQYLDQVPRYLDYNPYMKELQITPDVTVACKTGFFPGTRVDSGVIGIPTGQVAYCAMAMESEDRSMAVENEAAVVNGVIGRLLVEYWWPEAAASEALFSSPYVEALSG
jgi:beta-lactamase class A